MNTFIVTVTYDRVGGGWHPNDTFTEHIKVTAKDETAAESAAVSRFRLDYHPTARIKSITVARS